MVQQGEIFKGVKERESYGIAVKCVGIAGLLLLLCSCVSFDIGDWPSRFAYPHNSPPANLCGSIGAFCAYYLMYYVGPGVFVILVWGICFLVARLAYRPVEQPVFRAIGLTLLTVAASSSFYCLWPYRVYGFPSGSGGVLGVGAAVFLRAHFAFLGMLLLILATWIVGLFLLADSFILTILRGFGFVLRGMVGVGAAVWSAARRWSEVLGEIRRKLGARKPVRQRPALRSFEVSHFGNDVKVEERANGTAGSAGVVMDSGFVGIDREVSGPDRAYVPTSYEDYALPPLELLAEPEFSFASVQDKVVKAKAGAIEKLLGEFNINARVVTASPRPDAS